MVNPYNTAAGPSHTTYANPTAPYFTQPGKSQYWTRAPVSQQQGSYAQERPPNDPPYGSLGASDRERLRRAKPCIIRYPNAEDDDEDEYSDDAEWSHGESDEDLSSRHRHSGRRRPARRPEHAGHARANSRSTSRGTAERPQPPQAKSTAANVSRATLQEDLQVPSGFEKECFAKARDFGSDCAYDDHARVESALRDGGFRRWVWLDNTQTLILRAKHLRSNSAERIESSEFSVLSHYAASLAQWVEGFGHVVPLTFFCGAYKELRYSTEGMICDILRAFCCQLLSHREVAFDPRKSNFSDQDLQRLYNGSLTQLQKLFVLLVGAFARFKHGTNVVCFIDGLHFMEQCEPADRDFLCGTFNRLSGTARRTKAFFFKILLTQLQDGDHDWRRIDDEPVVLLDVPDRPVRGQEPKLGRSNGVTERCLTDLLPRPSTR